MQRDIELKLISECLELAQRKAAFMQDEETLVPVAKYIDRERFDTELRVLFRKSPMLVTHASRVAKAGEFVTETLAGIPVLVVRGRAGEVNAFINVCRHRGATVEPREAGSCKRFVCPYHAWTYDTDGSLVNVRYKEGFPSLDVANTSLVRLPALEAAGFVWVCPDASGAPDFGAALPNGLVDELAGLGCGGLEVFASNSRVWKANWKLIVDGGLESYHFKIAHRDTIAGLFLDNGSVFEAIGDHFRSVLPRTSMLALTDQPQKEWSLRKHANVLYSLFPNASLLVQEDHVVLIRMTPLAVDETDIEISTLVPAAAERSERERAHWQANHDFTIKALDEDFAIAEQIQRGAASGANEFYRFARFEGALSRWHAMVDARTLVV